MTFLTIKKNPEDTETSISLIGVTSLFDIKLNNITFNTDQIVYYYSENSYPENSSEEETEKETFIIHFSDKTRLEISYCSRKLLEEVLTCKASQVTATLSSKF